MPPIVLEIALLYPPIFDLLCAPAVFFTAIKHTFLSVFTREVLHSLPMLHVILKTALILFLV